MNFFPGENNSLEQRSQKLGASRNLLPLNWNKGCFWKFGPTIFRPYGCAYFFGAHNFRKNAFPTNRDLFSGNLEVHINGVRDLLLKNNWILFEMGPYGSNWAYINTGESHNMAEDHFSTPSNPPNPPGKSKHAQTLENPDLLFCLVFLLCVPRWNACI